MNNSRGFVMLFALSLLPVGLAILTALAGATEVLQKDLKTKYICRKEGLNLMSKASQDLKAIFKLNPKARLLRAQYLRKQLALATALARADLVTASAIKIQLKIILEQRLLLDKTQKILIRKSNLVLNQQRQYIQSSIRASLQSLPLGVFSYSQTFAQSAPVRLAIRPVDSDIAPEYIPEPSFEKAQALAFRWQFHTEFRSPFKSFLKHSALFKKHCAVSIKENQWSPQIVEVNLSSSSAW